MLTTLDGTNSLSRPRSIGGKLVGPSDAPTPVSCKELLIRLGSTFVSRDEFNENVYRFLGVLPVGPDRDCVVFFSGESHDLQGTLGIGFPFAFYDDYVRVELLRPLDELRRGPRV
jgi:hypothetical protein